MIRVMTMWLAAVLGICLLAPSPVQAHTASTYYPNKWGFNADEHWFIDDDVPYGAGFRDQIKSGIAAWDNGVFGLGPNFIYDGEVDATNTWDECEGGRSRVFSRENLGAALGFPSESVLGYTPTCRVCADGACILTEFMMVLERTATLGGASGWYTGDGSPGSNQWDLRSIAVHESGHATGFYGHFTTPGSYCDAPAQAATWQTMCTGHLSLIGTTLLRTLNTHDAHTYENAYY